MLVIRIWNYFRGYVIIKIEGLTLEKFINLSIAKDIFLWDIVRLDYTTLEAKISINGFKDLKEVVRKVGCRVSIKDKRGYPFVVHKFKYRKMLFLGSVVAIVLILYLTSFIWSIDVVGNKRIKNNEINKQLALLNVKSGIAKSKVDTDLIKNVILSNIDGLSYAHAQIKGTKLIVEVKEKDVPPEMIDDETPCNIVAEKKAVIEKIYAKNGKSQVEKGDIVKEGQILISGIIKDERMENALIVHSDGKILGRTWYSEIIEDPIIKSIKEETGRVFTAKEIKIGDKRLQLLNGDIPFTNYIEDKKTKKLLKTKAFELPIEIISHIYKEVNIKRVTQNVDALKKITAVKGVQQIMNKIPTGSQVLSKDVKYSIEDNVLITEIRVEVIEEIGRKEKIQSYWED
ncbi:sporulation protein YqfD [Brassicibacter mesophilus]|uniref:sporulation protein YqfD n=1 Tax=Brassicibacter mesophilus TaxID=745119 RepID=UPI003D247510